MATTMTKPKIDTLILDANPLITLKPLRGLARRFVTTPHVIAELRDPRAREHWERLRLIQGVDVLVRQPGALAISKATAFARKTGDYAVLSKTDMCILALTLELDEKVRESLTKEKQVDSVADQHAAEASQNQEPTNQSPFFETSELEAHQIPLPQSPQPPHAELSPEASNIVPESLADRLKRLALGSLIPTTPAPKRQIAADATSSETANNEDEAPLETLREPLWDPSTDPLPSSPAAMDRAPAEALYNDPSSEDDGEGEWITPTNVAQHQARAKDSRLVPAKVNPNQTLGVACMTSDFAMQNVLLQMGLNLVSSDGKKIDKDPSKKFCPSCGGPTLIRASVTVEAADASKPGSEPGLQVHLKKNFQYRLRGTNASLPPPQMGRARGGGQPAIVLREDQTEWQRAVGRDHRNTEKEERRATRALEEKSKHGSGVWMDQDWIPDLLVGGAANNVTSYPKIGYNPKHAQRKKKN
ncbi:Nin1 binding protein [Tulasnella sp. 330]|nr:Nin1 binding protein [Tulasnella sp. 330]KAG8884062.1 Nin1 binding protein [Tulasnella sp. 331]